MQFNRSPQTRRIEGFRVLRKADFRVHLPVRNFGLVVAFVPTAKAGTLKRVSRSFEGFGSNENIVIVLRPEFQPRAIVGQQRNSLENGILHVRFLKRIDDRSELLKDFRGSKTVIGAAPLKFCSYEIWKKREIIRARHPPEEVDRQPTEVQPRQSLLPFSVAKRFPGSPCGEITPIDV